MRSAAQRQGLAPAGPDLEGEHAAALTETRALLRRLGKGTGDGRLILELIDLNDRLAALRVAHEDHAAEMSCQDHLTGMIERPAPPRPRRPGRMPLMRVVRGA
jgi:hypothetical protein